VFELAERRPDRWTIHACNMQLTLVILSCLGRVRLGAGLAAIVAGWRSSVPAQIAHPHADVPVGLEH
jgi:hypothetical protein